MKKVTQLTKPRHGTETGIKPVDVELHSDRYCSQCNKWVECKGIVDVRCCPVCKKQWPEP